MYAFYSSTVRKVTRMRFSFTFTDNCLYCLYYKLSPIQLYSSSQIFNKLKVAARPCALATTTGFLNEYHYNLQSEPRFLLYPYPDKGHASLVVPSGQPWVALDTPTMGISTHIFPDTAILCAYACVYTHKHTHIRVYLWYYTERSWH